MGARGNLSCFWYGHSGLEQGGGWVSGQGTVKGVWIGFIGIIGLIFAKLVARNSGLQDVQARFQTREDSCR